MFIIYIYIYIYIYICLKLYQLNIIKKIKKEYKEKLAKELQYGRERYQNLSEDEKQKLVDWIQGLESKNYYRVCSDF